MMMHIHLGMHLLEKEILIMTKEDKLGILAEAMDIDVDELKGDVALSSFDEWDSLAALSFMSLLYNKLQKRITPAEVKNLQTVADAIAAME